MDKALGRIPSSKIVIIPQNFKKHFLNLRCMILAEAIVRGLMRLLSWLPLRVHYALGRFISFLAEKVFRYRVHDVTVNLSRSFPEYNYKEIAALRHRFYLHFGEVVAETVWFGGLRGPSRLHRSHLVELENAGTLKELYDAAPGVVVLMSHAGNWELIGGIASYVYNDEPVCFNEQNFCVVYLRQSSAMWDRILADNRKAPLLDRKGFPGYVESRSVVRYALEHKGEKKIYNFITDQSPYFDSPSNPEVEFMNRKCRTMKGAASLAIKMGYAVCYLSMRQEGRGHYVMKYIPICADPSAETPGDIMQAYYRLLEEDIRTQEWNYLWSHRRWK